MKARTIVLGVVGAILIGAVVLGVAGPAWADGPWGWGSMMRAQTGTPGNWGGMMDDQPTPPGGWNGWGGMMGPGMMGGWNGMTGPQSCPMYGDWDEAETGTPLTAEQATQIAERYIAAYGDPDLEIAEIMEFSNHFYVQARESSTGRYAFEFLIDRFTGATHPEPGPNMMWNTKYGHMGYGMGGMMGGWWNAPTGDMSITPERALQIAQEYLDRYQPGREAGDEADAFYGYYTIHVLQDGQTVGMLSVNGYTGQVWPHTWHGEFLGMADGEAHE